MKWLKSSAKRVVGTTLKSAAPLLHEVKLAWDQRVETLSDIVRDAKSRNALAASSVPTRLSIIKSVLKTAGRTTIQTFVSVIFLAMLPMVGVSAMLRRKDVEYVVPRVSNRERMFPVIREPRINHAVEGAEAIREVPPGHVDLGDRP